MAEEKQMENKTKNSVPMKTRILWGFGGLSDNVMFNVLNFLFLYVYVNYFKMDPALVGIALAIPRFFDAITDPMVGNFSDNFRSRWGRRRPLIFFGVISCAILLPLHWTPPCLDTVNNAWYCNGPFLYIAGLGCLYALAYTFFGVPYTALGFELTDDYDERTRVLAWRMYLGLIGALTLPWIYKVCVDPEKFSNIQQGAIITSIGASVFMIITGMLPVFGCKEKPVPPKVVDNENHELKKQNMFAAFADTFRNKPFLILVLGFFVVLCGTDACGSIGNFLNLYLVFNGDEVGNAKLAGTIGSMGAIIRYFSIFFIVFLSRKTGKREAFLTGMVIWIIAYSSMWFTITPKHPYAQLISWGIWALANQGLWLTLDSMMADICDDDELQTGRRREGIFGAVRGFIQKASGAITVLISGFMLKFTGFDVNVAQTSGLPPEVAFKMKAFFVVFPVLGCVLAFICFLYYPISRKRSHETRRILEERAAARQQANMTK
ncbi:MAG: MFS transporter [Lentisphaeria bacterium]|nr:MFS transporter [Lentisphaeria bacterium]